MLNHWLIFVLGAVDPGILLHVMCVSEKLLARLHLLHGLSDMSSFFGPLAILLGVWPSLVTRVIVHD
jgi:hypothetical protein